MATTREGFNVDIVGRVVRATVLNEHLVLPLAAAATYLSLGSSRAHLAQVVQLAARAGVRAPMATTRAIARQTGRVGLVLGAAGLVMSVNDWLNKWFANNWTANARDEWDWDREIVVVTGGSSGLGASIAQKLVARNPRTTVVVIDFAPLSWTPPSGSRVYYYQADLSSTDAIRRVCEQVRAEIGHPTVLVSNAGLARGFTVMEGGYSDVDMTLKTNLRAPFLLAKEFLPHMAKQNHGHVVHISSMSSIVAMPDIVDYAASKSGILSLHEGLQVELLHRHAAPKVRLSLGIFSFIQTSMFTGRPGSPNFIAPLLHVETVSDAIVDTLYSGYGRTLYLPGIMRYITMLRAGPDWMLRMLRNSSVKHPVDYKGRQKISKSGGLSANKSKTPSRGSKSK